MSDSLLSSLLRATSSLFNEAEHGITKRRAGHLAQGLEEHVQDAGPRLGQFVHSELGDIMDDLRSISTTTIDLPLAVELATRLSLACRSVSRSSSIPRRSPALPLELISLIIELAQSSTDFHKRQQTNLALSYVSRDVHRLVRPCLRREVHITRGWHLRGLKKLMDEEPTRRDEVKVVSVIVDPAQLEWKSAEAWFGPLFWPVLQWLALNRGSSCRRLKVLHVHLPPSKGEFDFLNHELDRAFGTSGTTFACDLAFVKIDEFHLNHLSKLPDAEYRYRTKLATGATRLYMDAVKPVADLSEFWREMDTEELFVEPQPFEVLVNPHAALLPSQLFTLLPNKPPVLRQLEITIVFPAETDANRSVELRMFTKLFRRLRPSLRKLVLRIRSAAPSSTGVDAHSKLVSDAVTTLPHLHTLAIGGTGLSTELATLLTPSLVEDLTLLPTSEGGVESRPTCPNVSQQPLAESLSQETAFPRLRRLELQFTVDEWERDDPYADPKYDQGPLPTENFPTAR